MSISLQEALSKLEILTANGRIATRQELRALASEVSVQAAGSITVLYGGDLEGGVSTSSTVKNMAANNPNLRLISNTWAASFLTDLRLKERLNRIVHH